jgi:hypothetical protein
MADALTMIRKVQGLQKLQKDRAKSSRAAASASRDWLPYRESFVEWAEGPMGLVLTVAQRTIALVAFDRRDPVELDDEHRDMARRLFGPVDRVPELARRVLVAMCGARGGKTYIFAAMYCLWRMLTADISQLAPGELAVAACVAPDKKLARQILRYVKGAVDAHPDIAPLVEVANEDALTLRRSDGRLVSLEVLAATRGGSALRGRSLICAVLDEAAFFRDQDYAVNDAELFDAVAPRVISGGMTVIDSTPWAEAGLLFELFSDNHGKPTTAIAAHAPTSLLAEGRPDGDEILARVEIERTRDPENAAREFDAIPLAAGTGLFFAPSAIDACLSDDAQERPVAPHGVRTRVGAGGDLALRSDSSALAIVHQVGDHLDVVEVRELRPTKAQPLRLSWVCQEFAETLSRHKRRTMLADQHEIDAAQEHMDRHGVAIEEAPGGSDGKALTYSKARQAIHSGRVRIPRAAPWAAKLVAQLKSITVSPLPGGGVAIRAPRTQSGHGDLVSALVLALYDLEERGAGLSQADQQEILPSLDYASRWEGMGGRGF